ncbi:MAG: TetR/AcrR family transcriptional regulator [Syntrophobacteraceae bacterium]
MQKSQEQQAAHAILKKLANVADQAGVIESMMGSKIASASPEVLVDELARCFLSLQAALKTSTGHNRAQVSGLIEALGEVARGHGISPSLFYPALLERVLAEPAPDETGRLHGKPSTKERILDAALDVFSQKGFHSATTDEIAERAGVGKGTVYRHFETKEKLFEELVRLRLDELERLAGAVIDGHDDVLTMISKYIQVYFEFFDRNQRLYRLIVQERLDLGENSSYNYFRRVMRALPNLKRKVYEGSQQGILKDIDFQTVFYGAMGFAHGVIQKWLARDCSYSLVEELPGVLEVLFYGFVKNTAGTECEN